MALPHLAARIFSTPLLIAPSKLDAILSVVGPRLGMDLEWPKAPDGPEGEDKERGEVQVEARIAVVPVVGTLANRVDALDAMSGMTGYETLGAEIDRLAEDPDVDAILLEVDSFGGEAAGCFDLADRIFAARQAKPVYGVANQYAMSAGYALLSQCEKVFVPQSGEVGSIGVVTTHVDMTAAAAQEGVRVTHIHAGTHKVDTSPFVALTDEAKERLAADVGQLYEQFVGLVARGGRVDAEGARGTEALTYIGERAVEAGLADAVGTRATAMEALVADVKETKRMKDYEAKNAKLVSENAALRARVEAFEAAEKARAEQEQRDFLEDLRTQSATAQCPIDEAKLAKVAEHFAAGRADVAHELGEAYLAAALAGKGEPARTLKVKATQSPATDHETAVKRGLLRNEKGRLEDALRANAVEDRAAAKNRIDEINKLLED